jgi:lactoylglutathione lyase
LEKTKPFYKKYFLATANDKYFNPNKNLNSYFLSFEGECRLEIMQMLNIADNKNDMYQQYRGIIRFDITVGSKKR